MAATYRGGSARARVQAWKLKAAEVKAASEAARAASELEAKVREQERLDLAARRAEYDRQAQVHEANVRSIERLAREHERERQRTAAELAAELELACQREVEAELELATQRAREERESIMRRLRAQQPQCKALVETDGDYQYMSTEGMLLTAQDKLNAARSRQRTKMQAVLSAVVPVDGAEGRDMLIITHDQLHGFISSPLQAQPGDTFTFKENAMELFLPHERSLQPACHVKRATWLPAGCTHWSRDGADMCPSQSERMRKIVGPALPSKRPSTRRPLAWPTRSDDGADGGWGDDDGGGRSAGRSARDLEAYEAEADGGEQRGDGYDQGYDHGRCRGSGCDDGGRYERYEDGYRAGYDEAGIQDDQSECGDGGADDPGYEEWYYGESYGDAEDHGGEPWSGAAA